MIIFKRRGVRIGECWFSEKEPAGVDIVRFKQRPDHAGSAKFEEFSSLLVDLAKSEEDIFAGFDKTTAYQARRSETKDGVEAAFDAHPDAEALARYAAYFDGFAAQKGLSAMDRPLLKAYADAGVLVISSVTREGSAEPLVVHGYIALGERARLLHSASLFRGEQSNEERNVVGRANRMLHWADMKYFKGAGFKVYDFGGWYSGELDEEKLRINRFKEGFGGAIEVTYNYSETRTARGRLLLLAQRLRRAFR